MNIYKLRNRFGYRATSIIRFACHNSCINKKCGALISVDISTDETTDTFKAVHLGHGDRSCCEIEVRRSIEQMKLEVAKEPTIDPKDIYDRNITAVIKKGFILSDIHNYIPPYQQFRGTLNKIKEKERPALPKSLKDIDFKLPLFKQWTETIEGTQFLRYDNLNNARRIIIFMSEYGIEWLRDATRIHSDGTFEICPELFFQFYVLFGTHGKGENSRILPCGYFLLPGKNEEVYSELFTALKEIIKPSLAPPETPALEPSVALTDFEPAVQNALIDAFPGIDIKGCFFHFKHAIHDWITQHGYKIDYNSNSSFRVWVDMLSKKFIYNLTMYSI
jgi:hypothetical protein